MRTAPQKESKRVVAYVPFATFLTAIDGLSSGLPYKIDTSLWLSYSPAIKAQLLGTFKFLGLVDAEGRPTDRLKTLVRDKANRKALLREILRTSYSKIIELGLTKISPRQFDLEMRGYGMTGETHKKVIFFFLKAARYADLPISPLLGTRKRVAARQREEVGSIAETSSGAAPPQGLTVPLKSGGIITLSFEGNILDLDRDDRAFFFEVFDTIREYEKRRAKSETRPAP
jgi:Family of unknown function (DUF5343)